MEAVRTAPCMGAGHSLLSFVGMALQVVQPAGCCSPSQMFVIVTLFWHCAQIRFWEDVRVPERSRVAWALTTLRSAHNWVLCDVPRKPPVLLEAAGCSPTADLAKPCNG